MYMAVAQTPFKINGFCYLMDVSNGIMFPTSPKEFTLRFNPRNDEFEYGMFDFNQMTHPRAGYWTGEVIMADSTTDLEHFANHVPGTIATSTNAYAFVYQEEATIAASDITLAYTPAEDGAVDVYNNNTGLFYVEGVAAANPNVYSIAANVITMPPGVADGTEGIFVNYFRTTQTAVALTFDPYDQPSSFRLYGAQGVVKATENNPSPDQYYIVVYARSCVITDVYDSGPGDTTIAFAVNNNLRGDLAIYRDDFDES